MQKTVRVRNKKDKSIIIDDMTQAMFDILSEEYELFPEGGIEKDPTDKSDEAIKKKAAKGAVDETLPETSEVNPDGADRLIDHLRSEYEIVAGKPADKRWKEEKLKAEIEKLNENK